MLFIYGNVGVRACANKVLVPKCSFGDVLSHDVKVQLGVKWIIDYTNLVLV